MPTNLSRKSPITLWKRTHQGNRKLFLVILQLSLQHFVVHASACDYVSDAALSAAAGRCSCVRRYAVLHFEVDSNFWFSKNNYRLTGAFYESSYEIR